MLNRSLRIDKRPNFKKHKPAKYRKKGFKSKKELSKESKAGRLNNMRGNSFERDLTKAYNVFFRERGIKGYAYRLKQYKYTGQLIDIVVDSPFEEFYQAVECKSMLIPKGKTRINFKAYFSDGQIENEQRFIDLTGRRGILAIEMRHDQDKDDPKSPKRGWREAYLVPFEYVWDIYLSGEKALPIAGIRGFPQIKREKAVYRL
jgi:hypothetical protein